MLPIRRLDSVSKNTLAILENANAILSEKKSCTVDTSNSVIYTNEIPVKVAHQDSRFAYLGRDMYKEADTATNVGKIWIKKEFIDSKTGNKEEWLVVYTNDDDEVIRQIASHELRESRLSKVTSFSRFAEDSNGERIYQGDKIVTVDGDEGIISRVASLDTVEVKWVNSSHPPIVYTGQESSLLIKKAADEGIKTKYDNEYAQGTYDFFSGMKGVGNNKIKQDLSEGTTIQYTRPEVINLVKNDKNFLWVPTQSGIWVVGFYDGQSWTLAKGYEAYAHQAYERMYGKQKQAAGVNPKNIPISPGIKSKNISMDETGGTENAKVTVEFTDATKGLDFYQNLEGIDTGKKNTGEEEGQLPQPAQNQVVPPQPPQPTSPQSAGIGMAQSSLKPTVSSYTQNGMKKVTIISSARGYSFINESGKEITLPWMKGVKVGSIIERPDTGERVRVAEFMEVNIQTEDEKIIGDIMNMLLDDKSEEDVLEGGIGDDLDIDVLDEIEVNKGRKVEREHTHDEDIIDDIVKDHLAEDEEYYNRLEKMEEDDEEIDDEEIDDEEIDDYDRKGRDGKTKKSSLKKNADYRDYSYIDKIVEDNYGICNASDFEDEFETSNLFYPSMTDEEYAKGIVEYIESVSGKPWDESEEHTLASLPYDSFVRHSSRNNSYFPFSDKYASDVDTSDFDWYNGMMVKFKPDYGEHSEEVYCLSQVTDRKAWAEDKDGAGWYVTKDQVIPVDGEDLTYSSLRNKFSQNLNTLSYDFDTMASIMQYKLEAILDSNRIEKAEVGDFLTFATYNKVPGFNITAVIQVLDKEKFETILYLCINYKPELAERLNEALISNGFSEGIDSDNQTVIPLSDYLPYSDVKSNNFIHRVVPKVLNAVISLASPRTANMVTKSLKRSSIMPNSSPEDQEKYIKDYAKRIKEANPELSTYINNLMKEYEGVNKSDYNINRSFESQLENLMIGVSNVASKEKKASALPIDGSPEEQYSYIIDYAHRIMSSDPEISNQVIAILREYESSDINSTESNLEFEQRLSDLMLNTLHQIGSKDVPEFSEDWIGEELQNLNGWQRMPHEDVVYHLLDRLEELGMDVSYKDVDSLLRRYKHHNRTSSIHKKADDISDSISPMGWTNQNSNNVPSGAGPALPQQPTLQNPPSQNNNVLYDSKKDTGPQFRTTVDPSSKAVTIQFLDSQEKSALDGALDQIQPDLTALNNQNIQPLPEALNTNNNSTNSDQQFGDQEIPVSF